jgi:hypothetical protein
MKNWTDEEILNFLMTSDFDENHSREELKSFLIKFRYYFRILSNKNNDIEFQKKQFHYEIDLLKTEKNNEIEKLTNLNSTILNIYNTVINRKLTWKERFQGKIKPNTNEII